MVRIALVLPALAAPLILRAADDVSERDIDTALASRDSFLRYNTWKRLNPEKESHYKILVQILQWPSWYDREGAIDSLRKAATEETLKKMVRGLKHHNVPAVRQGIAVALAKMNDEKFYPRLYEALKDTDPKVRRMVVWSLRVQKKPEAVDALIAHFLEEKDLVVQSFIIDALNSLTQAYRGTSPDAWRKWWEDAKKDPTYQLGETDEESRRMAEAQGNKPKNWHLTTPGVTLEIEERGGNEKIVSVPILILPYYGYSKETMKPFLSQLEKTNKLFYIDLPPIKSFKNLKSAGKTNIPYYPIDSLVEAFEELRKATKQKRFAIMACGMNSWIAMKYANLYPNSISHLVFICPLSGQKAYGDATTRMEGQGKDKNDDELHHLALTRRFNPQTGVTDHDSYHKDKKVPVPDGERGSIDRREWSLFFKDEGDSLLSVLYPVKDDRNAAGVAIPEYRCSAEKPKRPISTIVIIGKAAVLAGLEDCKQIAKHYGGQCLEYQNSSCMPFAEESTRFNNDMADLLHEKKGKGKDPAAPLAPAGLAKTPRGQAKDKDPPHDPKLKKDALKAIQDVQTAHLKELDGVVSFAVASGLEAEAKNLLAKMEGLDPKYPGLANRKAEVEKIKPQGDAAKQKNSRETLAQKIKNANIKNGKNLYELAKKCIRVGLFTRAYDLVIATLEADPDHKDARRALSWELDRESKTWITKWEAEMRKECFLTEEGWVKKKDRKNWDAGLREYEGIWVSKEEEQRLRGRSYANPFSVESEHFKVETNLGRKQAYEFAMLLESYYREFFRFFIGYYDQKAGAELLFNQAKLTRHQVMVFQSPVEYLNFLKWEKGNDKLLVRSGGFYSPADRRSVFFWDGLERTLDVLYHEVAHQLFEETRTGVSRSSGQVWPVEGIATYMETWEKVEGKWKPGHRMTGELKLAKDFLARESGFSLPKYLATEHKEFHEEAGRSLNYALGGALCHFLLHGQGEVYREGFIEFLRHYYLGKAQGAALFRYLDVEGATGEPAKVQAIEKQFREHMAALGGPGQRAADG